MSLSRCLRQTAAHPCGRTHRFRSKILEKVSPRGLKSTKLGPKINQVGLQNPPSWVPKSRKIHQVGLQNPPSWAPKSRKISLGRTLEGSWGHLGPKRHQDPLQDDSGKIKTANLGPKILPKSVRRRSQRWLFLAWIARLIFDAIWSQLGPHLCTQNHPKMGPKWFPNRCNLAHRFVSWFLMDVGSIFIDF